ncbi:MAG: CotH kinase family protein [Gammaproteobacteria bacterium]|nr:MAG: CotH kinase family protein [Gammaproteobacteria bacterium]
MKVVIARSGIDRATRINWTAYRKTIVLMLIAATISFAVAWIIKSETAQYGGVKWAAREWMRSHGSAALTEERPYLDLLKIPYYALRPVDVPQLVIDIDFKSFQKLQKKRLQAIERGLLVTGKNDFVPAKIRHEGKTKKIKLRLKGDLLDHLKGDKWSFRVKVKGKNHLYGMRVFSIQSPRVRGYQGGPLFYATLKHYGVLAPRYKLVNVVVNGSDVGIMSIEEHFSKELLESSGRKESVIIRFDESLVWDATDGSKRAGLGGHFDNYHVATIDGFGSKKIAKSERLSENYKIAVGLLRAFENGVLPPSEVFDVEQMGRYIAVSELWGSWHSFSWRNLRYYYNPITARLEPIGYDPDIQNRSKPGVNRAQGEPVTSVMRAALLDDPVIFTEFKKAVHLIREDIVNGDLIKQLKQLEQGYLPALRTEFFLLRPFDQSELEKRIDLLERYSKDDLDRLYQVKYTYPELLQAFEINSSGKSYVELANITPSPVEVLSIKWVAKKNDNRRVDVDFKEKVRFPLLLQPTPTLSKPKYQKIYFDKKEEFKNDYHLEVTAKVRGALEVVRTGVSPYYSALKRNPTPDSTLQQQALIHKRYLMTDAAAGTMVIKPGQWKVEESIVVPKNTVLKIGSATTLKFARNAGIISHGHVQFSGKENNMVILQGIKGDDWQGVAVLNADEKSTLSHVWIRGAKGMDVSGWALTGGVTFYKSEVSILYSIIEDSRGEDALNIVHSSFTLKNVSIKKTASDAFDADFSTGTVVGGLYENIGLAGGGDAIDVSGSKITIENTRFENIDDKAVSVGERSHIQATGLDINGTGTGAASKDASVLELSSSKIRNARVAGLMAYVKKPEYGTGQIIASKIEFGDGFVKARAQKGSTISIDGNEIEAIDIDVKDMYKTVMKKGLH